MYTVVTRPSVGHAKFRRQSHQPRDWLFFRSAVSISIRTGSAWLARRRCSSSGPLHRGPTIATTMSLSSSTWVDVTAKIGTRWIGSGEIGGPHRYPGAVRHRPERGAESSTPTMCLLGWWWSLEKL